LFLENLLAAERFERIAMQIEPAVKAVLLIRDSREIHGFFPAAFGCGITLGLSAVWNDCAVIWKSTRRRGL